MFDQTLEQIKAETALREMRRARFNLIFKVAIKPFVWAMILLGLSVWRFGFWLTPYEGDDFILSSLSIAGAFMFPFGLGLVFIEIGLFLRRHWSVGESNS